MVAHSVCLGSVFDSCFVMQYFKCPFFFAISLMRKRELAALLLLFS